MNQLYQEFLNDVQKPVIQEEVFPIKGNDDYFISTRVILEKSFTEDKIDFTTDNINTNIKLRLTIQVGETYQGQNPDDVFYTTIYTSGDFDLAKIPTLTNRGLLISNQMYFMIYSNEIIKGLTLKELLSGDSLKYFAHLILRSDNFRNISFLYKKDGDLICQRKNKYIGRNVNLSFFDLLQVFNINPNDFIKKYCAVSYMDFKFYREPEDLTRLFLNWIGKPIDTDDNVILDFRKSRYVDNNLYFNFNKYTLDNMRHFFAFSQRALGTTLVEDLTIHIKDKLGVPQEFNYSKGTELTQDILFNIDQDTNITKLLVSYNNMTVVMIKLPITEKLDESLFANLFNFLDVQKYLSNVESNENNFLYQRASNYYTVFIDFVSSVEREFISTINNQLFNDIEDFYNSTLTDLEHQDYTNKLTYYLVSDIPATIAKHIENYKVVRFNDKFKNAQDNYKMITLANNRNSRVAYTHQNLFINPSKELSVRAKEIQLTHLFYLCSIAAPESDKAGSTKYLTVGTFIDKFGIFRNSFINLETQEIEYLSPLELYNKKVAVEKFNINNVNETVRTLYRGDIIECQLTEVEYIPKEWSQVNAINIASGIGSNFNKSRRQLMENNELAQVVTIFGGEPTNLNTGLDNLYVKDMVITAKDILLFNNVDLTSIPDNLILIFDSIKRNTPDENTKQKETYIFNIKLLEETDEDIVGEDQFNFSSYNRKRTVQYSILKSYLQAQQSINMKLVEKPFYNLNDIVFIPEDVEFMENEQTQVYDDLENPSFNNLRLALSKNVTVAYMNYNGYCFEDGMVIREGLAKSLDFASIFTRTSDIDLDRDEKFKLTKPLGTKVYPGDIIGEVYDVNNELRTTVRVPRSKSGILSNIIKKKFSVTFIYTGLYYVEEGSKFAGFHGNKCTACKIIPDDEMPLNSETLQPVDICLNPFGVVTRDNMGQFIEGNLNELEYKVDPISFNIDQTALQEACNKDTLKILIDGRTGTPFNSKINVIKCAFMELDHHAEDKLRVSLLPSAVDLVSGQIKKGLDGEGGCGISELATNALISSGALAVVDYLRAASEGAGNFSQKSFAKYLLDRAFFNSNTQSIDDISFYNVNTMRLQKYIQYLYASLGVMINNNAKDTVRINLLTNAAIERVYYNRVYEKEKDDNGELITKEVKVPVYLTSATTDNYIDNIVGIGAAKTNEVICVTVPSLCWLNPMAIQQGYFNNFYTADKKSINIVNLIYCKIHLTFTEEINSEGDTFYLVEKYDTPISGVKTYTGIVALFKLISLNIINTNETYKPVDGLKYLINNFIMVPRTYRRKNKEKFAEADLNKAYKYLLVLIRDCLKYTNEGNTNKDVFEIYQDICNWENESAIKAYNKFYSDYFNYYTSKTLNSDNQEFRELKPFLEYLSDKETGVYRSMLLAKRVASSMGSVIVGDPEIKLNEVGIPFLALTQLYQYDIYNRIFNSNLFVSEDIRSLLSGFLKDYKVIKDNYISGDLNDEVIKKATEEMSLFTNRLKSLIYYNVDYQDSISSITPSSLEELNELRNALKEIVSGLADEGLNILIREPVLHRFNVEAFRPVVVEGFAIHINTLICNAYNADFDGDNMQSIALFLDEENMEKTRTQLTPQAMFYNDDGEFTYPLTQDVKYGLILGLGTKSTHNSAILKEFNIEDYVKHKYHLNDIYEPLNLTVGQYRLIQMVRDNLNVNVNLTDDFFISLLKNDEEFNLENFIFNFVTKLENLNLFNITDVRVELFNILKLLGFEYLMNEPATLSLKDLTDIKEVWNNIKDKTFDKESVYKKVLLQENFFSFEGTSKKEIEASIKTSYSDAQFKTLKKEINNLNLENNNFLKIVNSKAKGKLSTLQDLIIGGSQPTDIRDKLAPARIESSNLTGLSPLETFISGYSSLTSQYSTNESTKDAGELSRYFSDGLTTKIMGEDCGIKPQPHHLYKHIPKESLTGRFRKYIGKRISPDTRVEDIVSKKKIPNLTTGDIFGDTLISEKILPLIEDFRIEEIYAEGIEEPYRFNWELSDLSLELFEGKYGYKYSEISKPENDRVETVLTREDIIEYFNKGEDKIYVRMLTDCNSDYDYCAKCFGVTISAKTNKNFNSNGNRYPVGTEIGKMIATKISQRLTQAKMDRKHRSSHDKEIDTLSQFKKLMNLSDKYLDEDNKKLRVPKKYSVGFVNKVKGTIKLSNSKYKLSNLIISKNHKPPKGFIVTSGSENYKKVSELTNIDKFCYLILEEYYNLYKKNNLIIDPRCFELLVAIQTSMAYIIENESSKKDKLGVNRYILKNIAKKYENEKGMVAEVRPLSLMNVMAYVKPLSALGFTNIEDMLIQVLRNDSRSRIGKDVVESLNCGMRVSGNRVNLPENRAYIQYLSEIKASDVLDDIDEVSDTSKEISFYSQDVFNASEEVKDEPKEPVETQTQQIKEPDVKAEETSFFI